MIKPLKTVIVVLILSWPFPLLLNAQSPSDLMDQAKALVEEKKYEQAQQLLQDILSKKDDGDVRFYLGLLYSWNGQYERAREELQELAKIRPSSMELINARYNVEFWSERYEAAIDILDAGIALYPDELGFYLKKAKILGFLDRKNEAKRVLDGVFNRNPNVQEYQEAEGLRRFLKTSNLKNSVSLNGTTDFFSNTFDTWYASYLQYSRKIAVGTVIGRLNYANMFGANGYQLEADGYLSLWKGGYSYANVGFSPSSNFPDFRCGYEYYHSLPRTFEVSLGFRYLRFSPTDIVLYTGSVGKYFNNYWVSLRPHFLFREGEVSYSLRLSLRRYFGEADSYVGVDASYGTAPDFDHQNIEYSYLKRLRSYGVRLTYSQQLSKIWVVAAKLSLGHDEIIKGQYRNQTTIDCTVSRAF